MKYKDVTSNLQFFLRLILKTSFMLKIHRISKLSVKYKKRKNN